MPDENKPLVGQDSANATQDATGSETEAAGDKRMEVKDFHPQAQRMIEELRRENAKWRTEKNKAEEATRRAEEARLEGLQEWKTLAEQRATRLVELEKVKEQADAIEAAFAAGLEARLKTIPEDKRKRLVEPVRKTMSALDFAQWLDANEADLKAQRPPNLDAGAASAASVKPVNLSPEIITLAKNAGMTPQQYAESLERIEAKKRGTQ